jgi:hypothetical protein
MSSLPSDSHEEESRDSEEVRQMQVVDVENTFRKQTVLRCIELMIVLLLFEDVGKE